MSRKPETLSRVVYFVDDASEYLRANVAGRQSASKANKDDFVLVDIGYDYRLQTARQAVERVAQKWGVKLRLGNNHDLENFACSEMWDKILTVAAFGSFIKHRDKGLHVAVLIGGQPPSADNIIGVPTALTLEKADSLWGKKTLVLCMAE